MNYLITENQLRLIIESREEETIENSLKEINSLSKKIFSSLQKNFGIDTMSLLSWGAAIGGLIGPLYRFIQSGEFSLTVDEVFLILAGVTESLFSDNGRNYEKIKEKIKNEGLLDVFNKIMNKGYELKNSFIEFLSSLGLSIKNTSTLLKYSFLIPIITNIQNIGSMFSNIYQASISITNKILSSGVVNIPSELLSQLIEKILRRISK